MILTLEGVPYDFIPLKDFRAAHDLPPDFGVATFNPKDYSGLGRIDRAGTALNTVREAVLAVLPEKLLASQWLIYLPELTRLFQSKLYEINPQVGLKDVEIDYAVGGFSDVCQAYAYALVRAHAEQQPAPDFRAVYGEWLNGTAKIFAEQYTYAHQDQQWIIHIVAHAYGRIGLLIQAGDQHYAIYDPALACPAEGFMTTLLSEVVARMGAV
jgi:hypothetical protein